ncbi:hypothetical protein C8F04DRAFT_1244282 [Mycena alexandri]|uniref:Uncharacterized protein n=1 Tax=Mycena alexandri TaxID=1745969 RepID=A0AAD6S1P2_9AGAR|nr:hypothetical protein C8F04DRAFT_1244282 [Mycena alexandri]
MNDVRVGSKTTPLCNGGLQSGDLVGVKGTLWRFNWDFIKMLRGSNLSQPGSPACLFCIVFMLRPIGSIPNLDRCSFHDWAKKEKVVEKPDMVRIVEIEPVVQLQHWEVFAPGGPNMGCNINPKPLDSHIMNAPKISTANARATSYATRAWEKNHLDLKTRPDLEWNEENTERENIANMEYCHQARSTEIVATWKTHVSKLHKELRATEYGNWAPRAATISFSTWERMEIPAARQEGGVERGPWTNEE